MPRNERKEDTSEGSYPMSYLEKLDSLKLEADIESLDHDGITIFKFLSTCSDDDLRKKIFDSKRDTLPHIKELVRQHTAQLRSIDSIKEQTKVIAPVSRTHPNPQNQPERSSRASQQGRPNSRPDMAGRCGRCGRTKHKEGDVCFVIANNLCCDKCGKAGHIATVCRSERRKCQVGKNISRVTEAHPSDREEDEVTPRLPLSISHRDGSFPFSCFPDTGSATTLLSSDIALQQKIPVTRPHPPPKFVSVNGDPVLTTGVVEIVLQAPSSWIRTSAVMSPAIKNDLIVGFKDLKRLKVIPDGFPLRRIDTESNQIQALRNSLIREFQDVLTDSLPEGSMEGSPMKIFLTPGEKVPFRISTARPVPHHWEEKAKKAIQQLIDSKVIAKMSDPSDWCAPGFFVAKSNGEVRLVVDFTGLNKYIRRPIHTFPSSSDIVSGLDPQAQFFAKLDATQCYHQVPLDYDSSKLTTFLLAHGRFRLLRAPMGLSCSSDEFCRRSDEVIRDLPGVRKLVDDILIQAPSLEVLKNRISELLKRCRTHHFTLSQKKFEIGRTVNFAGFVVSRDGVFPNPDKLQGIRDFPAQ